MVDGQIIQRGLAGAGVSRSRVTAHCEVLVSAARGQVPKQRDFELEPQLSALFVRHTLDLVLGSEKWGYHTLHLLNFISLVTGRSDASFLQQTLDVEACPEVEAGLEVLLRRVKSFHTGCTDAMFVPLIPPELKR